MNIFLDMDGVLADFNAKKREVFGDREPPDDELWEVIHRDYPDWFLSLPEMEGAQELYWRAVEKGPTAVLTAVGREKSMEVAAQKTAWLRDVLDDEVVIIPCRRKHKKDWARPDALLIDDHQQNIVEWIAAGGIGMLYKSYDLFPGFP